MNAKHEPRRFRPRLVPTLARWRLSRSRRGRQLAAGPLQAKEALRTQYDDATRAASLALASLPAGMDWASLRYRPVTATGAYLPTRQVLIDNKVHAGRAGYHVVTPLALSDGRVVLVNRGWVGQQASRSVLPEASPPAGTVTVEGRLSIPPSGYLELKPESTNGPVRQNLDPARFAAATGLAVLPAVVEATAAPIPDDGLVRAWPAPDFGIDTHRIYMVQWYAFALLAAVLWLWFQRPRGGGQAQGADHE